MKNSDEKSLSLKITNKQTKEKSRVHNGSSKWKNESFSVVILWLGSMCFLCLPLLLIEYGAYQNNANVMDTRWWWRYQMGARCLNSPKQSPEMIATLWFGECSSFFLLFDPSSLRHTQDNNKKHIWSMQVKWKMIHKHKHKWNDGIKRYENHHHHRQHHHFLFNEKNVFLCGLSSGVGEVQQSEFFAIVFDQVTIVIPFELELELFKDFVISWFLWESFIHLSRTHTEAKSQSHKNHSQYFYLKIKNSNEAKTVATIVYENVMTQRGMGNVQRQRRRWQRWQPLCKKENNEKMQ